MGYTTKLYTDAIEGYQHLLEVTKAVARGCTGVRPYRLVILDINMSRLNGIDFLRLINSSPDFSTPVVVITGIERYRSASIACGAKAFYTKPIDVQELSTVLNRFAPLARSSFQKSSTISESSAISESKIKKGKLVRNQEEGKKNVIRNFFSFFSKSKITQCPVVQNSVEIQRILHEECAMRCRVLLLDDSILCLKVLARKFVNLGYDVDIFDDVDSGIVQCQLITNLVLTQY